MADRHTISRRAWLKGLGFAAGAAAGTRIMGKEWLGSASAKETGKAAVVSIFFEGGFNALFGSADSFRGRSFGVTDANIKDLGSGLFVDNSIVNNQGSIGSLDEWSLTHMAAIGVRHGSTDHASAQRNNFSDGTRNFAIQLASAIGGPASFKAAAMGSMPPGPAPAEGGVSLQLLRTMGDAVTVLGVGEPNFNLPARNVAANGLLHANTMSGRPIEQNRQSLLSFKYGYATQVDSLTKPVKFVDVPKVTQAYGVSATANLESMSSKLAAAELMVRAGTNVITIRDTGWDTHGDRDGAAVRRRMTSEIIPPLKTFLGRLRSDPELAAMNVSVVLHGDFARSLPGSDHANALTALVIGPNVKVGTTGRVDSQVTLGPSTGSSRQMWSYLAAISKVHENPFGQNPHALVR